jgi:Putative peptidoglycan binding domain
MPTRHTVSLGDCISSIAFRYGFFPDTVWNHADNAELKRTRQDANVLRPGDLVVVPDLRQKEVSKATEKRHRFRRKGVPDVLRLRILDQNDQPVANRPYVLEIDGKSFRGSTGGDGAIEQAIPPDASEGHLTLENWAIKYNLNLGHLEPVSTVAGVQKRLNNLGYECGDSGELDEGTRLALRKFQMANQTRVTGEPDRATQDKLKEVHRS